MFNQVALETEANRREVVDGGKAAAVPANRSTANGRTVYPLSQLEIKT